MLKDDFSLEPDEQTLRRFLGKRAERILKSSRNQRLFRAAIEDFSRLVVPVAAWKDVEIVALDGDSIILEGGVRFSHRRLAAHASVPGIAVIGVATIGPGMEEKSRRLIEEGQTFYAFLLDSFASWAAAELRRQFARWIREVYRREKGMEVSPFFSPGEMGWNIEDQRALFSLIPDEARQAGVSLENSLLMRPLKSVSMVMIAKPGSEEGRPL